MTRKPRLNKWDEVLSPDEIYAAMGEAKGAMEKARIRLEELRNEIERREAAEQRGKG